MNTELKIDPKFKNLIPPLSHEEFDLLEQSCLAEGIRDAIVTWQGFIIDGHNRYSIAQKHGLGFRTVEKEIATDADVIDWMINNQLGKRNITEEQKSYLRGKRYENEKNKQGGTGANQHKQSGQNVHSAKTCETLADEFNVNEKTIRRDAQFATGVDALPEVERKQVLQGKSDLTKKEVQSIGKAKTEAKKEVEKNAFFISEQEKEAEIARRAEELAAQRLANIKAQKKRNAHVSYNSGENEWYTPSNFIKLAREVMGSIDLDPASCEQANLTVGADVIYTKKNNGLAHDWFGNVWLNPPYAQPLITQFANKVVEQRGNYEQCIVLVNNATETKWFQKIARVASAVCFPTGRVKFYDPYGNLGAPLQGQAIIYIGQNVEQFIFNMRPIGFTSIMSQ